MLELTSTLHLKHNNAQGHPNIAATGIFLAKYHKQLDKTLPHEEMGVFCANDHQQVHKRDTASIK